ncbi:MAG: hypothetical protein PHP06_05835 [Clostridia bacterium]|nr:hypothetical protein [Clostridia bacterium]
MLKKTVIYTLITILVLVPLVSCNKSPRKPESNLKQQKDYPPKSLNNIESNIEKIIKDTGKSTVENKSNKKIKWEEVDRTSKKIHEEWNSYEVQAIKNKGSKAAITNFEQQLNKMTDMISLKNRQKTFESANELYQYVPDFLKLYKHNAPPELKKIKYHAQKILLLGENNRWDQTNSNLSQINELWNSSKNKVKKENQGTAQKISLSIKDFEQAVNKKNSEILKIKSEILIKNIESVR